eukprot:CAMPEP_0181127226 /NCGR_PEP_ID=MMETSP1071-20121207/28077_1 /TAXON_ID=35127 /ORGANISM="Thalassiosira sp., Strain NH16" /LENGTH=606 /DNA_ID=CAMNT_0023212935 /DNA_START=1397 /DNA_END=3214 /DNA_ORIENTATION=+
MVGTKSTNSDVHYYEHPFVPQLAALAIRHRKEIQVLLSMPHFLCFTDLSLPGNNRSGTHIISGTSSASAASDEIIDAESSPTTTPQTDGEAAATSSSAPPPSGAGEEGRHRNDSKAVVFVREEDKRSSFALDRPYALFPQFIRGREVVREDGCGTVPTTTTTTTARAPAFDGNDCTCEQVDLDDEGGQGCDHNELDGSPSSFNERKRCSITATASITSCISTTTDDGGNNDGSLKCISRGAQTTFFLFGGFELIANVRSAEVYVIRANSDATSTVAPEEEEIYLTTCKGVPVRDLPPLATAAVYANGCSLDDEGKQSEGTNHSIPNDNGEGVSKKDNDDSNNNLFYKFVFVSPGGPKPTMRVRLKFVMNGGKDSTVDDVPGSTIVVRMLKVKGRLSDSLPIKSKPSSQLPRGSISMPNPFGGANFNPGMMTGRGDNNMSGIASMMAMMGGNGTTGMPMAMQMNPRQQRHPMGNVQMQTPGQRHLQQQHQQQQWQQQYSNHHQHEKNQAEIISSVAGLGMFLKSSEERTMSRLETMMSNMETRIMKRLDDLSQRLEVIERGVDNTTEQYELDGMTGQDEVALTSSTQRYHFLYLSWQCNVDGAIAFT